MANRNNLSLLVSLIKINLIRNQLNAKVPYSKLNINVLTIMQKFGYVRGFRVAGSSIFVFLSPMPGNPGDIAYFSVNNKHNYISHKKLTSRYGVKNFLIVSTDIGLLTGDECFLYRKGGQLLLLIPN